MREIAFLHYQQKDSLWHKHDTRFKLLELIVWNFLAFVGSPAVLVVLAVMLVILHFNAKTSLQGMVKPFFFWFLMSLAIIISAALRDGENPMRFSLSPNFANSFLLSIFPRRIIGAEFILPIGLTGLMEGIFRAARLFVVLLAGQLFAMSTDPAHLADALRRMTVFLPRRWSLNLGTVISLTFSFLPLIFDEAATTRDAALSRGLARRRSVLRRIIILGLPLIEGTLRRADLSAEALLSRRYGDISTPFLWRFHALDFFLLLLVILPALSIALLFP